VEYVVTVQSDAYPVTVTWTVNKGTASYELTDGQGGKVFRAKDMTGQGSIKITNAEMNSFAVRLVGNGQLPTEYGLSQNYPNPFNPTTSIKYALPVQSRVAIHIYNVLGQRVRTLMNDDVAAGYHIAEWNGTGNEGQQLASGVYFLQMSATGTNGKTFNEIRKLMMLK
jgi:flagellar hook assembly protein FlgD